MADIAFTTPAGQTIAREMLVAYLNTGTFANPVWSAVGKRVEDSSTDIDWDSSTKKDILGDSYGKLKKPTITQSFDPCELDAGDAAQVKLWNLGVKDQDAQALSAQDMLIVHFYAGSNFAERYSSCMVELTGLGGEGGGDIGMPMNITYGGTRTLGSATKSAQGEITFVAGDGVPYIELSQHVAEIPSTGSAVLTAETYPAGKSVTWTESSSGATISVTNGTVTAVAVGSAIVTAKITVDGVDYSDTCTVIVTSAA